jgi:Na+-translocating ferredoxin:NAD+ oxidoreductase RnfC subunit
VYGAKKTRLVTIRCACCRRWQAVRVDPEDLHAHKHHNVTAQDAFITKNGKPYLDCRERELFISAVCGDCYSLLCPSDRLAYN